MQELSAEWISILSMDKYTKVRGYEIRLHWYACSNSGRAPFQPKVCDNSFVTGLIFHISAPSQPTFQLQPDTP